MLHQFFFLKEQPHVHLHFHHHVPIRLMVLWALWFIVSLIHYIRSGQYQIDPAPARRVQ